MFSVANHPGVKVDLDRWITQVRRVMAERDAYKEQVSHLTDIAQTAEGNLAWFHGDHEEDYARRLLRRLTYADNAKHATGHGETKDATSDSRARESAPEFRPAREGTVDTVTTTGSTTKKSAKMPDPPIFEGSEGSIDLENWLIGITSALQANAVVFRRLGDFREMFHLFFVRVSLGHNKAEFSDPQIQIGLYAGMAIARMSSVARRFERLAIPGLLDTSTFSGMGSVTAMLSLVEARDPVASGVKVMRGRG
ncbi:hypothetical protein E4U22_001687 [Claviceps purpurea]|nr:hypothetical protein E4U22_001687 [Claviceps purpurea]